MKNSNDTIEPATFRFVAQHLNHCATASDQAHTKYTETPRQFQLSDLTATHCQSRRTVTGTQHQARLAVSPI